MEKFLEKVFNWLKSDTVKTLFVMFVINGIQGITPFLPTELVGALNIVLPLLATYFRVNVKTQV